MLIETIERLINNRAALAHMAAASQRLGHPHAAATIAQLAVEQAAERRR